MKKNKKILMSVSLIAGLLLIMSTAFADSINKSAYEQLKDTIRSTASNLTESMANSTLKTTVVLKDNETTILSQINTVKSDPENGSTETITVTEYLGQPASQSYNFSDKTGHITYDAASDTYYVTEYTNMNPGNGTVLGENPFDTEYAADMEKIFDALVGNLKNYVVVTVNEDGSKEFSGSLTDAQIPALINAIVSFASKQYFESTSYASSDYSMREAGISESKNIFPEMSGDISVKSVSGKVTVNKDGVIDSAFLSGVLSGADADGNIHDLSLEALVLMQDINTTVVQKPDLTGKNVVVSKDTYVDTTALSQKFVGTYKCNIIEETPDTLLKIGERTLVVTEIADGRVKGSYTETYIAGYEDRLNDQSEFTFDVAATDPYSVMLQFTDKSGKIQNGSLYFDNTSYTVQFFIENFKEAKNFTFVRVFD
ncbi:MAG: hypothetical protein ACYCYM_04880 [Saccharofermentanales bacterium]